jgi:hypothetical protein
MRNSGFPFMNSFLAVSGVNSEIEKKCPNELRELLNAEGAEK